MCLDLTLVDDAGNVVGHVPGGPYLDRFHRDLAAISEINAEAAKVLAEQIERDLAAILATPARSP